MEEVGDTRVVVFRMESTESRISTVLIRGSTDNYMDDIERAIDDGVNTFKGIVKDGRYVSNYTIILIYIAHWFMVFRVPYLNKKQNPIKFTLLSAVCQDLFLRQV